MQFTYKPPYYGHSYWIPEIRYFWVAYDTGGKSEYDIDGYAFGPRVDGVQAFTSEARTEEPRYIVGGPLADPVITSSLSKVVSHVESQFEAVADRVLFNLDIERAYAEQSEWCLKEDEHASPIHVGGIGEVSAKRMARNYGAYSNIMLYDRVRGASRAYGNSPNTDGVFENVEAAVNVYKDAYEAGDTRSTLLPEDLVEYPKYTPKWWSSYAPPHTSRTSDDSTEEPKIPTGCTRGSATEFQNLGTLRNVILEVCGDGYWRLSPSAKAPEAAFEFLIPVGTEYNSLQYLQAEYMNNTSDMYVHDCWMVAQILERLWTDPNQDQNTWFHRTNSFDVSKLVAFDPEFDLVLPKLIAESVREHLSGDRWWAPTVGDMKNESYSFKDIEPELAYLLAGLSVDRVEGWRVRNPGWKNSSLEFWYSPEGVERTTWINALNTIHIKYTDTYSDEHNVDGSRSGSPKYVITDSRGTPFVSESIGRIITHLATRFTRIESVVDTVAQEEREYATVRGESGQRDILDELAGIGQGTIEPIAKRFGTYSELLSADELGITLSHHFDGDLETIKRHIRSASK